MTANTFDSIVIGGGLIGMMTARELGIAGHKVAVLDSKTLGSESSWAGGGILSPLYPWNENKGLSELTRWSQQYYPALADQLYETTGIDPEWIRCGMKILAVEEPAKALQWAAGNHVPVEIIGSDEALWMPEVAQIRNPLLISALKKYLEQIGVEIHENTSVRRIKTTGRQVDAIGTTNGDFSAGVVVIASGAWSAELLPDLAIRPVRGQMICYQAEPGTLRTIIMKKGIYMIPRRDGHILVGSTMEEVGFDKGITEAARVRLTTAAEEMLPGIHRYPLTGHWAGLRPAALRNIPYIGPHPEADGLFVNTGHHRNGILHAPGSARLLADIILRRERVISADIFQYRAGACADVKSGSNMS